MAQQHTIAQQKNAAQRNTPLPSYILAGPEFGKRDAFIAEIVAVCTALDGAAPEMQRLYAQDTELGALLGLLRNGSLFASRRILEYRGAESIKAKSDLAALADYLRSPSPDAILFLVTEGYSLEKEIETALGAAAKKTFFEMFESEKPRWVRDRLRRDGISIDEEGIDSLLELIENESGAMEAACMALAAAFPQGSALDASQIEAAIARSRQEDTFSLFDRMASSDLSTALSTLDAVLADRRSDAIQIIAGLIWSFRRIGRLHAALGTRRGARRGADSGAEDGSLIGSDTGLAAAGTGTDFEAACLKVGGRGKTAIAKLRRAAARFSPEDCERAVKLASDTDGALRGGLGSLFERTLLHGLIYSIMEQKARSTILPTTPSTL